VARVFEFWPRQAQVSVTPSLQRRVRETSQITCQPFQRFFFVVREKPLKRLNRLALAYCTWINPGVTECRTQWPCVARNLFWRKVNRLGAYDNRVNMKTFLFFSLSFILVVMCSCRDKTSSSIMKEDLEKIFNEKIPTNTPKSEVMAFLNSVKIGSRSVESIEYRIGRAGASWVDDSQPMNLHSHIKGIILNAGTQRDGFYSISYHIAMHFYFDENEKLIGYHLQPLLDADF
jgi:hypothetical protein